MLADFVLQWRAGVFPVFVGQTIHAFNGAVFPLRVCPLYQHLGGILDLLTFHRLGFFALQHLVVVVCGLAGLFGCYFSLAAVAPHRRWSAALLAVLYLSCPGVLAAVYTQDLYMTWTAVPFLPLAVYGTVRTFQRDDWAAQCWLAAPLAALWWAHSPVAMWTTGIAAGIQAVRLALVCRDSQSVRGPAQRAAGGALIFAALAQYPIVSFATLHSPSAPASTAAAPAPLSQIPDNIRSAWPRAILPLSPDAGSLGDIQLGYGLLLAGALAAVSLGKGRDCLAPALLLGSAAVLGTLLIPLPSLNPWLWHIIPKEIRQITYYWPMQRFYPIMAALIVFSVQLLGTEGAELIKGRSTTRRLPRLPALAILTVAAAWSLWQSARFIRAGEARTSSAADSIRSLLPENLLLMNHSYGLFTALPPYFSNGVMDPSLETRLLKRKPLESFSPAPSSPAAWQPWRTSIDSNPGILDLAPAFRLRPGRRYTLQFRFSQPATAGVLEITGRSVFRQYRLPASGERLAFGSGPENSHALLLWTSDPRGDEISLRFIPTSERDGPAKHRNFGSFAWRPLDPSNEPVAITSLLPFQASVNTPTAAWVETPRMYLRGYEATVNGRSENVRASPAGLAMIAVAPGASRIELRYRAPALIRLSYCAALAAWALLLGGALAISSHAAGPRHHRSSPATVE